LLGVPSIPVPASTASFQITSVLSLPVLGLAHLYGFNIYRGDTDFIYSTVPIRLAISLGGVVAALANPDSLSGWLALMILLDSIGSMVMGWQLGTWTGVAPGTRKTS